MDFVERIRELAGRIPGQLEHIRTEEACKSALVMPFINALGYNVFDPSEVTPELIADVGTKKGEKVDYAILRDGKPIILFECKSCDTNLDVAHASQLYRYFSVTPARFGVLTNGLVYRFFSDLEAPNKMDAKPFFELNMLLLDEFAVGELKKFSKGCFDVDLILATAGEFKYMKEIKRILLQEMTQPSDDFVRLFVSRVYEGRVTQPIKEQFAELTRKSLQQFISERVSDRLKSALADEVKSAAVTPGENAVATDEGGEGERVVTTQEETDGFNIVRAIASQVLDIKRVTMRDQRSYCAILVDNNNRRPLCRLWFNSSRKYLGLFDDAKTESRIPLNEVTDIFRFANQLRLTAEKYLSPLPTKAESLPTKETEGERDP
jgi:predicted type IV restriction endonuclease